MMDVWRIVNAVVMIKLRSPYLRVGQIIANAAEGREVFFVADSVLADSLETYVRGDK